MHKDYTALTIRRDLIERLKKLAKKNKRSPQGQIDYMVAAEHLKQQEI